MQNSSNLQNNYVPKSPHSKPKHIRDDSSLDKCDKLKTVQSCRRITTEQSDKLSYKFLQTMNKKTNEKNAKLDTKNNKKQETVPSKQNRYSSLKNSKNIKPSISPNKKIQSYLQFFSPKNKNVGTINFLKEGLSKNQSTNIVTKPTLKKVCGMKVNQSSKVNKTCQQQKITPFIAYPPEKVQKSSNIGKVMKKTYHSKVDKSSSKIKESKSKGLKTLQNENISFKHRNSNKDQSILNKSGIKRYVDRSKMYHNVKMKTQQSMMSCQSTPSQILTHDIELLEMIGQGTFGQVYKAIIKKTSQLIAVKKVFQDKKYKNREVQIVSLLTDSSFVMKVLGTYITYESNHSDHPKQYLNIVMKYYEADLFKDIQVKKTLTNMEIKIYSYQIFRGLMYLHSKNICHRDIKPHNLLTNKMSLAICDFGSAKILNPLQKNLPYICSRCYRAPQLIFGSTQYTTMIDIWSVGCVILQMIHGYPFFIGNSSIDHLIEVIKVLGTPTKSQVREMNPQYDLKDYKFPNIKSKSFKKLFPETDPLLLNLLEQIMIYAPKQRLNAAQALVHEFFDQIRDEITYTNLRQQFNLPDFFDFSLEQIRGNQHLYGQLIPSWYSKTHQTYFQQSDIEKNNMLKLYYD